MLFVILDLRKFHAFNYCIQSHDLENESNKLLIFLIFLDDGTQQDVVAYQPSYNNNLDINDLLGDAVVTENGNQ